VGRPPPRGGGVPPPISSCLMSLVAPLPLMMLPE